MSSSKTINGTAANDTLVGTSGDDIINGLAGADKMSGGAGNDTYYVDNVGDQVIENSNAGTDAIISSVTYALSANVENLALTGTAAINGAGNALNNVVRGNDVANVLDGRAGSDFLYGDGGNDTLIYTMTENSGATDVYAGGSGTDTLRLNLTYAQWTTPGVQTGIANYLKFLATATANGTHDASDLSVFHSFGSFDLYTSGMEKIVVSVDGLPTFIPTDQPVALSADTITATEESASASPPTAINVLANDSIPDLAQSLAFTQGAHGTVTLANQDLTHPAAGQVAQFVYTPNSSYFQYLAAGETATHGDSFTYTVTDANGGVGTATAYVDIAGVNDAPVITAQDLQGGVTEQVVPNGNLTDTGVIQFTDLDLKDVHLVSPNGTAVTGQPTPLGSLTATLDADTTGTGAGGQLHWTYTVADSAVAYLAKDETRTESFNITLDDQKGGVITEKIDVTITGVDNNHAPVFPTDTTGLAQGEVTEGGNPSGVVQTGKGLTYTDADPADTHIVTVTPVGSPLGTVSTNNLEGSADTNLLKWFYSVDNAAIQYLGQGKSKTESFTITVDDQHGGTATQQIDIKINGSNDAPTAVAETLSGTAADKAITYTASQLLGNDTDPDTGDQLSISTVASGTGGTVVLNPDQSVTFTPNATFSGNATFNYTISDGNGGTSTTTDTIPVTAINHPPTVETNKLVFIPVGSIFHQPVDIGITTPFDPDSGDTVTVTFPTIFTTGIGYKPQFAGTDISASTVISNNNLSTFSLITMAPNGGPQGSFGVLGYTATDNHGSSSNSTINFSIYSAGATIAGGSGNDVFVAAPGATLTGAGGSDTFILYDGAVNSPGEPKITDFSTEDHLSLHDVLVTDHLDGQSLSALMAGGFVAFQYDGSQTLVNFDADGSGGGAAHTIAALPGFDLTTHLQNVMV